jgi:hypothetical protein
MPNRLNKARKGLHRAEGDVMYSIDCFGDYLAKREGYKNLDGIDAVHYYLIQKYKWFPSQVRALNVEDLEFLLKEEMHGWTFPAEAR